MGRRWKGIWGKGGGREGGSRRRPGRGETGRLRPGERQIGRDRERGAERVRGVGQAEYEMDRHTDTGRKEERERRQPERMIEDRGTRRRKRQ